MVIQVRRQEVGWWVWRVVRKGNDTYESSSHFVRRSAAVRAARRWVRHAEKATDWQPVI